MSKRAWMVIGAVLAVAACSSPTGPGVPYSPSGAIGNVAVDSLSRPQPHGKQNLDQPPVQP